MIYVYNKCDLFDKILPMPEGEETVVVSGVTGHGIDRLLLSIETVIHKFKRDYNLLIPYSEQSALSSLYNSYIVKSTDYLDNGIAVVAVLDEKGRGIYGKYISD